MLCNFFIRGPPEALEMDLSQEGPDQNFEYSINAGNQILRTFAFMQLFDPRLPWGSRPWIKSAVGAINAIIMNVIVIWNVLQWNARFKMPLFDLF